MSVSTVKPYSEPSITTIITFYFFPTTEYLNRKQYANLRKKKMRELTVARIQEANGHKSSRPNMGQELPPFWLLQASSKD